MVKELDDLKNEDRSLFPSSLTIRAIRDSRYHNTAYAIAELIDNSIDASAERIELLCMERLNTSGARNHWEVFEIAVLDKGTGMDIKTLFDALKFGGGTRHESTDRIGKYGMGLPTASMSQCKRVDVWTWQRGPIWHSSIDADNIEKGDHEVPMPDNDTEIPEPWRLAGSGDIYKNHSGTLVVWSKLDKIHWKKGNTIIDHVSREIGRIHRHLIEADITRIRAITFKDIRPHEPTSEIYIVPNDPLYLMSTTSTPSPWDTKPMFEERSTKHHTVLVNGREETITIKYSITKPEALKTGHIRQYPGDTEHGKHARHNIGVSVIREEREIVLEDAFLREGGSTDNPRNRWWGCEVYFRRNCDELFGVDHNKQMVAHFTQAAKTLARDDRPLQRILDEMGLDEDPIYQIVGEIRDQTRSMMRDIGRMFSQRQAFDQINTDHNKSPERKAVKTATDADTDALNAEIETPTQTDIDREKISPAERKTGLAEQFIAFGQPDQDAHALAKLLVEENLFYQFNSTNLDGYQMFNVRSDHGVLHINLNTDHPIYSLIRYIEKDLSEEIDENSPVFQASVAIRLLLSSWARMEDQTNSRDDRMRIQDIAMNWGRQVDKVIRHLRDRDD